eukprot:COSAG02_NODE_8125_length_2697_cov_181.379113_4_plen_233_part_00
MSCRSHRCLHTPRRPPVLASLLRTQSTPLTPFACPLTGPVQLGCRAHGAARRAEPRSKMMHLGLHRPPNPNQTPPCRCDRPPPEAAPARPPPLKQRPRNACRTPATPATPPSAPPTGPQDQPSPPPRAPIPIIPWTEQKMSIYRPYESSKTWQDFAYMHTKSHTKPRSPSGFVRETASTNPSKSPHSNAVHGIAPIPLQSGTRCHVSHTFRRPLRIIKISILIRKKQRSSSR